MKNKTNITDADVAMVRDVRKLLMSILAVPVAPLEHAVQIAHESPIHERHDPDDAFKSLGVTRQALRMFWHFRCNIEAVMPRESM